MTNALRQANFLAVVLAAAVLTGCGGNSDSSQRLADSSQAEAATPVAGINPHIATVPIHGEHLDAVTSVNYSIAAQAGTVSKPVSVTMSRDYLSRYGYAGSDAQSLTVPVFGLYDGAENAVTVTLTFSDQSTLALPVSVTAAADVLDVYSTPQVQQARAPGSTLGFDFLYIKGITDVGLIILDTDGRVRWHGPTPNWNSAPSTFLNGEFVVGRGGSAYITRIGLDGSVIFTTHPEGSVFQHDLENGKAGVIDNVDVMINGVSYPEAIAEEIMPDGTILKTWDLGVILSDFMSANGDDPALFVRPPVDWFHMNTAIYVPEDESIIVSSRENFLVKLDYETGAIRWIFGDPEKYWYTFPSLRSKSLALAEGGHVPIGQHAVTITPDGKLMIFNNGEPSLNQPEGTPAGASRPYSEVSAYTIDEASMTATQAWSFDYGQAILSRFCSSARQTADGSVLVDYATAESITAAYLVGLDPQHNVVFDYRYPSTACNIAWNSQPFPFDALTLD